MDDVTDIDSDLRDRARRLVVEALRWFRSADHWIAIDGEVENLARALHDHDELAVRRAVEELEILGPNRTGRPVGDPPPAVLAERLHSLADLLAGTGRGGAVTGG